jgi:hypothetical protein
MQGPMGIPSNQTAAFGRGAGRVAREVGPWLPDLLPSRMIYTGAKNAYKGLRWIYEGRKMRKAAGALDASIDAAKNQARMVEQMRKAGYAGRQDVVSAVEDANKVIRQKKRAVTMSRRATGGGQKKLGKGLYGLGSGGSALLEPLGEQGGQPAPASDPGKLGAQRQLAGRSRMLKDGKLQKLNGRQMWMSDDGEVQTEYTITIKMPNGGYANVPSFNPRTGQNYPTERAALEGARNEGYVIKTFPTAKKAALAAEYKSQKLGVQLRGMGY